jgi:hypothetical protein
MTSARPLAVDLFTGEGGWARHLHAAGFRVVGIDLKRKPKEYPDGIEYVQADIRKVDGQAYRGARVVVASPMCNGFSEANAVFNPHLARPEPDDVALFLHALRVIQEAAPEGFPNRDKMPHPFFWAVENVKGALPFFEPFVGGPKVAARPWFVWGNFPGFLLDSSRLPKKTGDVAGPLAQRVYGAARRAKIPGELAGPFAGACMEGLRWHPSAEPNLPQNPDSPPGGVLVRNGPVVRNAGGAGKEGLPETALGSAVEKGAGTGPVAGRGQEGAA